MYTSVTNMCNGLCDASEYLAASSESPVRVEAAASKYFILSDVLLLEANVDDVIDDAYEKYKEKLAYAKRESAVVHDVLVVNATRTEQRHLSLNALLHLIDAADEVVVWFQMPHIKNEYLMRMTYAVCVALGANKNVHLVSAAKYDAQLVEHLYAAHAQQLIAYDHFDEFVITVAPAIHSSSASQAQSLDSRP